MQPSRQPPLLLLLLLPPLPLLLPLRLLLLLLLAASCALVQQEGHYRCCGHRVCRHALDPCPFPACQLLLLLPELLHHTNQNLDLWDLQHLPYRRLQMRYLAHPPLLLLLLLLCQQGSRYYPAVAAEVASCSCWQFRCRWCLTS
jgi:hypothetical protein